MGITPGGRGGVQEGGDEIGPGRENLPALL